MNADEDIFLAANLGSEVARLLRAKEEHDTERASGAYGRACALMEELEKCAGSSGQSEVAILRTVLNDLMQADPTLSIQPEVLRSYFLPYAHKALGV